MKPVVVDLFCGLGGWSRAFMDEGYEAIGFDIERHEYMVPAVEESANKGANGSWFNVAHGQRIDGNCAGHPARGDNEFSRQTCIHVKRYPGELILRDVREINGHELRHAVNPAVIVASPPCQEFSYMAMPFSRGKKIAKGLRGAQEAVRELPLVDGYTDADELAAKQIAAALRGQGEFPEGYTGSRTIEELKALFNAAFRIARECGCPLVVENVKGAQPWVGRAKANYGSYYLWGDIANIGGRIVRPDRIAFGVDAVKAYKLKKRDGRNFHVFENGGGSSPSFNGGDHETRGVSEGVKCGGAVGDDWFVHHNTTAEFDKRAGVKHGGDCFNDPAWAVNQGGVKVASESGRRTDVGKGARFTSRDCGIEGVKQPGHSGRAWFADPDVAGSVLKSRC